MPQEMQPSITMDIGARIRILENKYNTVNEHLLIINQNMIEEFKKLITEMKVIDNEIRENKQDILNIKETVKKMFKETEIFARKDELKVLEKYINLWNPIEFITKKDLDEILSKKTKRRKKRTGKTGRKKR